MSKIKVEFENGRLAHSLYCNDEKNLRIIERKLNVKVVSRDNTFILQGSEEDIKKTESLLKELHELKQNRTKIDQSVFLYTLGETDIIEKKAKKIFTKKIPVPGKKKEISPKTEGQRKYVDLIQNKSVVFAIGPAGTGKTYLAMAMAIAALKTGLVKKIILTRPAVEAGETLGFLPGDLYEKILPFLTPLYDALHDMIDEETLKRYREREIIEIVPLAYMRGRTLNDAFIILDEAQNSTLEQMKMFLTRLGFGSKAVITGDITQIDLPLFKNSGLVEIRSILGNIDGIEFTYFTEKDVIRHPLVSKIIKAYERYDKTLENHEKNTKKKKTNKR